MKKIILLVGLCFSLFNYVNAQSLRWGVRGGSSDGIVGGPDETVVDMATDPDGNIYVLSSVFQTSLSVDGHPLSGYGSDDILLSSFKCDGTYRWSKLIGGNSSDFAAAVKTDTLGGVYITGYVTSHSTTVHIDADTSFSTSGYQTMILLKYDTAGAYKWLRMPEADTVGLTASSNNRSLDMDVDGQGNVFLMIGTLPGAYADGSYIISTKGVYILKYNSTGMFLNGTQMQIDYSTISTGALFMKRDYALGKYYITGNFGLGANMSDLTFNGNSITKPLFLGAFDNSGNLLWYKQNTSPYSNWFGKVALDANHEIYIAGSSEAFASTDTFNSYPIINAVNPYGTAQLVVKLDTNGNNIWAKNTSSDQMTYCNSVIINGSSVTVAGNYNGKLLYPGYDSLSHAMSGEGYDVFILSLDVSTGNFIKLDSITSGFSDNEYATGIAADTHGNVYVGGNMSGDLYVNGDTLISNGGGSDFFVAKYGYDNCGCTTTPTASYNYSGSPTVNFTYTGTTTSLDSVVWNFGDGGHATGNTATHSYANGTYNACVTAYTSCGSNVSCQNITIGGDAVSNVAFQNMAVYPNPAQDALFIENAPMGATITLFNIMEQQVYGGTITSNKQQLNTTNLPGGSYILQFTDKDGNRVNRTIVKQ